MAKGQDVSQIQSLKRYLTGDCPNPAPHQASMHLPNKVPDHTVGAICPFSADSADYRLSIVVNEEVGKL